VFGKDPIEIFVIMIEIFMDFLRVSGRMPGPATVHDNFPIHRRCIACAIETASVNDLGT
jgi:hypothetical protein